MPVIQSYTRAQLRTAVGVNALGYPRFFTSTTTGAGSTTVIADTGIPGDSSEHIGKWVVMTSGAASGEIRQVSANTAATSLTVGTAFSAATGSGSTYEMFDEAYPIYSIHNWINQAISFATGKAFDPEEDVSLHLHPEELRYAIPSSLDAVRDIYQRVSVKKIQVDACDSGWTQQTNVTQVFDTTIKRQGSGSLRLLVDAAAAAGDIIGSKTITSTNFSEYDTMEFWIRCTAATAAGAMTIRLLSGSDTITFSVPALVADTWTLCRVSITGANQRLLTAVTTIQVRLVTDAANTVWVDDINMVQNSGALWERINPDSWTIDKEAGDIVLGFRPKYYLLKIVGGGKPVTLDADGTTSEIDPTLVIAKATALALMANPPPGGAESEMALWRTQIAFWEAEAQKRVMALPNLTGYRDAR